MLKLIFFRFRALVLLCLTLLLTGLLLPDEVQAAKTPKALLLDQVGRIEVATVYETAYATQKATIKALKVSNKSMKKATGFKGAATLRSQDGKQVIVFSQWQDAVSYQTYASTANTIATKGNSAAVSSAPSVATLPSPTHIFTFQ